MNRLKQQFCFDAAASDLYGVASSFIGQLFYLARFIYLFVLSMDSILYCIIEILKYCSILKYNSSVHGVGHVYCIIETKSHNKENPLTCFTSTPINVN